MSFTDDLKRSLGFEETESSKKQKREGPSITDTLLSIIRPPQENNAAQRTNPQTQQYRPNPQQQGVNHSTAPNPNSRPSPKPTPVYDDYDDFVIIPEQSFYEIILIRPKTVDDINYVVDQVIEEQNPVILDLSFLEKESAANFKLAGDKIKQMRARYGAQALLLARTDEKNLIIVSPKKVKVINKG